MDTNKLEEIKTQITNHEKIKKKLNKLNNDINTKLNKGFLLKSQ